MPRDLTTIEVVVSAERIHEVVSACVRRAGSGFLLCCVIGVEGRGVVHLVFKGETRRACLEKLRKEVNK